MTDKRGRGVAVAAGAALPSSPGARKAPLGRVERQVAKAAEAEVEGTGRIRAVSSGRRQEMGGSGKDLRYAQHDALKGKLHACWAVIVRPPYLSHLRGGVFMAAVAENGGPVIPYRLPLRREELTDVS